MHAAPVTRYDAIGIRAWSCLSPAGDARATWQAVTDQRSALRQTADGDWLGTIGAQPMDLPALIERTAQPLVGSLWHDAPPVITCATSKGDIAALEQALQAGLPAPLHRFDPGAASLLLARLANRRQIVSVPVVAACSTGLTALLSAADLLEAHSAEEALCGSADASCTPFVLAGFQAMGVTCGTAHPGAATPGFAPAEGAGFMTLARGLSASTPWRLLAGVRLGEASHETRCSNVEVLVATYAALWQVAPQPDLLVLHGTGTRAGDAFETEALAAGPWRTVPTICCKPFIGHSLGASGMVELAAALTSPARVIWKVSLGFGGHLAAVAVTRYG